MEGNQKEKNIPIIIFLVIQIFIIIVLISLATIFSKDDKVDDTEYNEFPSIGISNITSNAPEIADRYVKIIERELTKAAELNNNDINIPNINAIIREETANVKQFEGVGGYFISTIIDIPNLKQSYKLFYHYPAKENSQNNAPSNILYVLCLDDDDQKIYPDFNCKNQNSQDIYNLILTYYLKYYNFNNFSAFADYRKPGIIYVAPNNFDIDDNTKQNYVSEVKNTIKGLNIPPDIFSYRIIMQSDFSDLPD